MSRLTNKKLVDLKYGEFLSISKEEYRKQVHEAPTYKEIYTKLGQLEDLEDELGCSILDVFKALKEGIKIDFGEQLIPPKLYYDDVYNKWKFKIDYYSTAVGLYNVKDVVNGINMECNE